jgi:hypothetical protein
MLPTPPDSVKKKVPATAFLGGPLENPTDRLSQDPPSSQCQVASSARLSSPSDPPAESLGSTELAEVQVE